jgi:hypothetical protein
MSTDEHFEYHGVEALGGFCMSKFGALDEAGWPPVLLRNERKEEGALPGSMRIVTTAFSWPEESECTRRSSAFERLACTEWSTGT